MVIQNLDRYSGNEALSPGTYARNRTRVSGLTLSLMLLAFGGLYAIIVLRTTFFHNGHLIGTLFDDALISLRYALNFNEGYGLVWNLGEATRVEGYTNPL